MSFQTTFQFARVLVTAALVSACDDDDDDRVVTVPVLNDAGTSCASGFRCRSQDAGAGGVRVGCSCTTESKSSVACYDNVLEQGDPTLGVCNSVCLVCK